MLRKRSRSYFFLFMRFSPFACPCDVHCPEGAQEPAPRFGVVSTILLREGLHHHHHDSITCRSILSRTSNGAMTTLGKLVNGLQAKLWLSFFFLFLQFLYCIQHCPWLLLDHYGITTCTYLVSRIFCS